MTILIIFVAIVFAAIFVGVAVPCTYLFKDKLQLEDVKLLSSKNTLIAASLLVITNLGSVIEAIINYAKIYNDSWLSDSNSFGVIMQQSFGLSIYFLYICIAVALILKSTTFSLGASAATLVLTVFNAIFIQSSELKTVYREYFGLMPKIMILASLTIILVAILGQQKIFYRYKKLFKLSPWLLLFSILCINISVYPPMIYNPDVLNYLISGNINLQSFTNVTFIFRFVSIIINSVAFMLIFKTLSLQIVENKSVYDEEQTVSTKEKIILILSLLLLPVVVNFLSSISKAWLFGALILLAIAVPAVIVITKNSTAKTKAIALICTFSVVIGLCVVGQLLPSSYTDPDGIEGWTQCYKCKKTGKVRNELGFYVTCPRCDGVGYLPD